MKKGYGVPTAAIPKRTRGIYLTIGCNAVSLLYVVALSAFDRGDLLDPYNIVIHGFIILSIVGLWLMKKWGAALTVVVTSVGIFTGIYELQVAYFNPWWLTRVSGFWSIVIASALYVVIGSMIVIHVFQGIFAGRFT